MTPIVHGPSGAVFLSVTQITKKNNVCVGEMFLLFETVFGCPGTHADLSTSVSQVLGLKMCATKSYHLGSWFERFVAGLTLFL